MTKRYNPYQVICTDKCKLYDECNKEDCTCKSKSMKGCNYSKKGDCKYCSHKDNCILLKPYSDKLKNIESKRHYLEQENQRLYDYISEWREIEYNLSKYDNANSVLDVVFFPKERNTISKMLEEIHDNEKLIEEYLDVEKRLLKG